MDSSDSKIQFDENGFCNHCTNALERLQLQPFNCEIQEKNEKLNKLIAKIKKEGRRKPYDCVIGLSGGIDSSYVAYLVYKHQLRALAVHLDNGWNSNVSVSNIEKICSEFNFDLHTEVLYWQSFRDLQKSFIYSNTPDLEIPTDHAIYSLLFSVSNKYGIKYIISGSNLVSESIMPENWSYGHYDFRYIKSVNNKFLNSDLTHYPHMTVLKFLYYTLVKNIKWVSILNYVDYNKKIAIDTLKAEINYREYGEKHTESIYTKFYQNYFLPKKFGIYKFRAHLSSLILSKKISRSEALELFNNKFLSISYEGLELEYVLKKLEMSDSDFQKILSSPNASFDLFLNNSVLLKFIFRINRFFKNIRTLIL